MHLSGSFLIRKAQDSVKNCGYAIDLGVVFGEPNLPIALRMSRVSIPILVGVPVAIGVFVVSGVAMHDKEVQKRGGCSETRVLVGTLHGHEVLVVRSELDQNFPVVTIEIPKGLVRDREDDTVILILGS